MADLSGFERWWLNSWPHRWHVRRFVPEFLKNAPDPFRGEVLEIGSGAGWTTRQILETFPQVELTATDLDWRAINKLEDLKESYGRRLKIVEADMEHLPFDRAAFDISISVHALHYANDLEQAVQQLVRVTRPGGMIGVADGSRRGHEHVEQVLVEAGVEDVVGRGNGHFYIWGKKGYD